MEDVIAAVAACVQDKSLYIEAEKWFDMLQDPGADVTQKQRSDIDEKTAQKGAKKKRFTRAIIHNYKLYPKLYMLSQDIYSLLQAKKEDYFEKMGTKGTSTIHGIGEWIAANRRLISRADIYSEGIGDDLLQLATGPKHGASGELYFLSQSKLLTHAKAKWGSTVEDVMKPTINDKLRLAMLLFHEDPTKE